MSSLVLFSCFFSLINCTMGLRIRIAFSWINLGTYWLTIRYQYMSVNVFFLPTHDWRITNYETFFNFSHEVLLSKKKLSFFPHNTVQQILFEVKII
jgi:hypothetical protein